MIASIRYCLSNLANFEGRDARSTFWYYILFLVAAQFAVTLVASIPLYVDIFTSAFSAAANAGGRASGDEVVMAMAQDISGHVTTLMYVGFVVAIVITLLLLASFVRRLHDAGYTGWIAAIPVATQIFSQYYAFTFAERTQEIMIETMNATATGQPTDPYALQVEMGLLGLVGWIGYIVVIGFGVLKSQEGPNQYGEAPVRF